VRQTAADPYQSRYTCTAQGATTLVKFCARSPKWGQNRGLGRVPRSRSFLSSNPFQTTFQQLSKGRFSPNMATKRKLVSPRRILKDIFENIVHSTCSRKAREFQGRSTRFRSYWVPKFPNFRILAYFPHTKRRKTTFLYALALYL